jgi:hypothetical protein
MINRKAREKLSEFAFRPIHIEENIKTEAEKFNLVISDLPK